MPERLSKLHLYICIVAALIVTVICILRDESLYRMSVWVSVSIIIFYAIGQMIRLYLTNKVFRQLEDSENTGEDVVGEAETEPLSTPADTYVYDSNNNP